MYLYVIKYHRRRNLPQGCLYLVKSGIHKNDFHHQISRCLFRTKSLIISDSISEVFGCVICILLTVYKADVAPFAVNVDVNTGWEKCSLDSEVTLFAYKTMVNKTWHLQMTSAASTMQKHSFVQYLYTVYVAYMCMCETMPSGWCSLLLPARHIGWTSEAFLSLCISITCSAFLPLPICFPASCHLLHTRADTDVETETHTHTHPHPHTPTLYFSFCHAHAHTHTFSQNQLHTSL